jgi:phosphoesterase RecJ-like protein
MNFVNSKKIFEYITANDNFVINCHMSPDLDSVASASALKQVLNQLNKKADIISTDKIPDSYKYLPFANEIIIKPFKDLDFKKYKCWLCVDSERLDQAGAFVKPNVDIINIDHHPQNDIKAIYSILKIDISSTCEILSLVFEDWNIEIGKELATTLLSGITYDSNFFQQKNTFASTHLVAGKLMNLGADNNYVNFKVKRSNSFGMIKLWGEFNKRMKIDKKHKFVWTALPYSLYSKYLENISSTAEYSNMIARTVTGTNFSIVMSEKEPKNLTMSIRARVPGFDVSGMAREIGGGGHKDASGAGIKGMDFSEAVKQVLKIARKFSNQEFVPEIPLD